jgi:hypothetical protein
VIKDQRTMLVQPSPDGGMEGIGYWSETTRETNPIVMGLIGLGWIRQLPHPTEFINPSWSADVRARTVELLKNAPHRRSWGGWSKCRICGKENGTTTLGYAWLEFPVGLAHYVEHHAVKLDDEALKRLHECARLDREAKLTGKSLW